MARTTDATPPRGLPTDPKLTWPPKALQTTFDRMRVLSAWYGGDPEELAMIHGGLHGSEHPFFTHGATNRPSQYRGGLVGSVARWFWGAPTPSGERRAKLHVPIAGDIATLSADLLFSEPPKVTFEDSTTQGEWDRLAGAMNFDAILLEAAEVQSPLGGVYIVVTWDDSLYPHPFLRAVHHDAAIPEWQWGRLAAVTFWRVVEESSGKVYRHLERHERGRILHGLYVGASDVLGPEIPLTEHPSTRNLPSTVPGVPNRLTVAYVPNLLPNRLDRNSPLGRSDYSPGVLTLMDALDETYSSWMRDLRLAKHRLVVPRAYMQHQGPGQGARFEAEREIFELIDSMPRQDGGMELTPTSFAIRVTEHAATADNLVNQIVGRCGYSAQSVGEQGEVAVTATEVEARERRSFITRKKKARYWRSALPEIIETLMIVHTQMFGGKGVPTRPTVEFGDAVAETPEALARTLGLLETAVAISTQEKVRRLNPDWTDEQIEDEAERILDESGKRPQPLANPDEIGGRPTPGGAVTSPKAGPKAEDTATDNGRSQKGNDTGSEQGKQLAKTGQAGGQASGTRKPTPPAGRR